MGIFGKYKKCAVFIILCGILFNAQVAVRADGLEIRKNPFKTTKVCKLKEPKPENQEGNLDEQFKKIKELIDLIKTLEKELRNIEMHCTEDFVDDLIMTYSKYLRSCYEELAKLYEALRNKTSENKALGYETSKNKANERAEKYKNYYTTRWYNRCGLG